MRIVRMSQYKDALIPGSRAAGCYLMRLVFWKDVDTDGPRLCEDTNAHGA